MDNVYSLKFLWFQTVKEEVPIEDDEAEETPDEDEITDDEEDDEAKVEEEDSEEKPKTKEVEKTVWDWLLVNDNKPIWTRK